MWFRRSDANDESVEALENAKKNLKEVRDRGDEVKAVADFFREFRERNHIAEQLEGILVFRKGGHARG